MTRARAWAVNAGLLLAALAVPLLAGEAYLRYRYSDRVYEPGPEVRAVQRHLVAHPEVGFTWRPGITADAGIRLEVADMVHPPLATDAAGAINPPEAMAAVEAGRRVDVLGVGDSFMEHAAHVWHERFAEEGLLYYNRAIHRQAPPQYNALLENALAEFEPRWVVYGLFENDFAETTDYLNWRRSGMGWFEYHSGTWCGPPVGATPVERALNRWLRGYTSLYYVLRAQARGQHMTVAGPSHAEVAEVAARVVEAAEMAHAAGAGFILLLIPAKASMLQEPSAELAAYDRVADVLRTSLKNGERSSTVGQPAMTRIGPSGFPLSAHPEAGIEWKILGQGSRQTAEPGLSSSAPRRGWPLLSGRGRFLVRASEPAGHASERGTPPLIPPQGGTKMGRPDTSPEDDRYVHPSRMRPAVGDEEPCYAIALAEVFEEAAVPPESLYYEQDAHWNADGAALAAEAVLARIVARRPADEYGMRPTLRN